MGLINPFNPFNPLINSIIVYIILILLLIYNKPNIIYDKKTKKFKQFGMSEGKSILSLPVLAILLSIIIYIIFSYVERSAQIYKSYHELTMNK
jgi:hypothetical protein